MHKQKARFSMTLVKTPIQSEKPLIPNKHAPTDWLMIRCPESGVLKARKCLNGAEKRRIGLK